eukprot:6850237-Prymnesium_polylepis.1
MPRCRIAQFPNCAGRSVGAEPWRSCAMADARDPEQDVSSARWDLSAWRGWIAPPLCRTAMDEM